MELVELLLIEGAVVDADSVDGTPLQIAVSRGNVEAAKGLLSRGANVGHEINPFVDDSYEYLYCTRL